MKKTEEVVAVMKKLRGVMAVLLVCAAMAFPFRVWAAEIEVSAADLNAGATLPPYEAGDTLRITGGAPLGAAGWETLKNASTPYALILDNGQTSIPDNAMAMNSGAPTSVTGAHVTRVGKRAFYGCISLASVNFPALAAVDEAAFYVCAALESISLSGVSSLGNNAFRGCEKLGYVSMPEVESVPDGAFANCFALAGFDLPKAKTIGRGAFDSNSSLTVISLPAATVVEMRAFYRASSVTELSLPSVREIGSEAFSGCTALKVLRLGDADPSVSEDAFAGVGRLTIYSNKRALTSGNYPPYDLATPQDGGGGGCNATAPGAWLLLILCAALFLRPYISRGGKTKFRRKKECKEMSAP